MTTIANIFAYDFLTNAFVACVLSGITCGIVGSYIVARRMVFLSSGITHASFGGLGIALYMGINPLVGALSFAAISSLGIEFFSRRGGMREDSAIGIIWSLGMALGALFMSLRPGYATDLTSYLFGNILLVNGGEVAMFALLTIVVIVGAAVWLRKLMYVTFDEDFARSQGVPVVAVAYIMAVVVALTIVMSIKVMGIILLLSLITIPVVVANTLTMDYRRIAPLSAAVAVLGNVVGFLLSYQFDLPTGSCIIFILVLLLAAVKLFRVLRVRTTKL
ncbi:MAG: metal ABC transporter permease [Alistipes sp.]|nr:metal ABC transporter permease [Alistipes sp.]